MILTLFRWLFRVVVGAYFIAALAVLVLRYGVLPRVDQWRPQIEAVASQMLGTPVHVGAIAADWQGLHPRLRFAQLRIDDAQGQAELLIPQARATLAWRSVLLGEPHLLGLEISGLDVALRRDAQGGVWLAGRELSPAQGGSASSDGRHASASTNRGLRWLLAQNTVVLRDATLRWHDAQHDATQALVLSDVNLRLHNTLLGSRFVLTARPPSGYAARLAIQAELEHSVLSADRGDPRAWSGQLYAQIDDAVPVAWQAWLKLPAEIPKLDRLAARAWLDIKNGEPSWAVADVALRGVDARYGEGESEGEPRDARLLADALDVRLEGSPSAWLAGAGDALGTPTRQGNASLATRIAGHGVALALPAVFEAPLPSLASLAMDMRIERADQEGWTVALRHMDINNADLSAQWQGVWRSAGRTSAGTLDMQGLVAQMALNAVHRYLPLALDAQARAWLRSALVAGQARGVAVTVRGDLADFPFNEVDSDTAAHQDITQGHSEKPERKAGTTDRDGLQGANRSNSRSYCEDLQRSRPPESVDARDAVGYSECPQFRLAGGVHDAVLDYAPAGKGAAKAWPRLEGLAAEFDIERTALRLRAQSGSLRTGEQSRVTLARLSADIPDLAHATPILHIDADTSAQALDYLALMRNAPLGELLDHSFDQTQGTGTWRVPLRLDIALADGGQTQVQGQVRFADASLTLAPGTPALTQLNGTLAFGNEGASADGLQAQWLGGPVRISGELSPRGKGLRVEGTLRAEALFKQWPVPALQRLSGQTTYTARLSRQPSGAVDVSLESSLQGLASDLPAPLNKTAQSVLPLAATWGAGRAGAPGRWLGVRLGDAVDLLLEQAPGTHGSYFRRAALGVGRPASPPTQGLALDIALAELDLATWRTTLATFNLPTNGRAQRALLPDVQTVQLRSATLHLPFMALHDVTLDARLVDAAWQANVRATEASGSGSWRAATAQSPARLLGRFEHLMVGDPGENDAASPDDLFDAALDFPDVELTVQRFSLYGRALGALTVSGANAERRRTWRVKALKLTNPDATLSGTGVWRLTDAARGLALDATLELADLGGMLRRLGQPDRVAGGKGTLKGQITWRNLPWQHRLADLDGELSLALEQGVFSRVNSFNARLLELLALQSLSNVARLSFDPTAMFRDGYRFDSIRGDLKIARGAVHTDGLEIDSPAATIVLGGNTDLVAQRWNLDAVVVPKLDASGAAIAAAVINPLVGLGALLAQQLLKDPLARAMTARYKVTGTWDEPVLAPLGEKKPAAS